MEWCVHCGRPRLEIVEAALAECDGVQEVVHGRYLAARRDFDRLTRPIIEAVLRSFHA
jgi:hypothetical protein